MNRPVGRIQQLTTGKTGQPPASEYERWKADGGIRYQKSDPDQRCCRLSGDDALLLEHAAKERGLTKRALVSRALRAYLGVALTDEERGKRK